MSTGFSRRSFLHASAALAGGTLGGAAAPSPTRGAGPIFDVRDFGAVGNGDALDTAAIQRAIDAARAAGGGVVLLPAGTWQSGTLHLHSHVTVELGPGAVLRASPDDDAFDPRETLPFSTGADTETTDFAHAFLAGRDLERVTIRGVGVIDMQRRRRRGPKPIALKRCRFVVVQGITILHAPNYAVSLGGCDDVLIDSVTVRAAYADGIDPDCCQRVRITNCDVESDDDALCLKASFALGVRASTQDVIVSNCRLSSPSNCFKLGTESTGDFRQIVLTNCVLVGRPTDGHDASAAAEGGGIALLTVDGGTIDGVVVTNVAMRDVVAPLFLRLGDRGRDQQAPRPGRLRNVSISSMVATGASVAASITGLPGHPVEQIRLTDVRIEADGGEESAVSLSVPERPTHYPEPTMFGTLPTFGLYLRHARDITLRDVALRVEHMDARPPLVADDVARLRVAGLTTDAAGSGPLAWLHDVQDAVVRGDSVAARREATLRVTGDRTRGVTLVDVEREPEIAPAARVSRPDRSPRGPSRSSHPRRPY